jgi:hypothetical protein
MKRRHFITLLGGAAAGVAARSAYAGDGQAIAASPSVIPAVRCGLP